jgi:cyclic-di-AMP phosphodiesterase PgpH
MPHSSTPPHANKGHSPSFVPHAKGHSVNHVSGIASILPKVKRSFWQQVMLWVQNKWFFLNDSGGFMALLGFGSTIAMATLLWGLQALPKLHPVFASFQALGDNHAVVNSLRPFWNGLGLGLISALFFVVLWLQLLTDNADCNEKSMYRPAYGLFITTLSLGSILLLYVFHKATHLPLVAFPLGVYTLMVTIFTTPRLGITATTLLVVVAALVLNLDGQALGVLWFGSIVGVFGLTRCGIFRDRSQLMRAGLWLALGQGLMLLSLDLVNMRESLGLSARHVGWLHSANPFIHTPFGSILGGIIASLASALLVGPLTLGILPFLEWLFQLVTPYRLTELSNHNQPLLKRMQFEAPGTFHHSIMVASLSEAAAEAIGANPLLARVGSLYHDIGKMKRSLFFIENQAYFGVDNPHDKLTPRLSKMVITAHPRDSLEMAEQYGLPHVLRKFMTEHHGTLLAGHFYNQACKQEGVENVDKASFRYPGPKPNIKETAIVMLADACESACRAIKQPTPDLIDARIDTLVKQRIDDGQFDECPISMQDITIIKQTFSRVLRGIQHQRLEYHSLLRPITASTELSNPQ